MSGTVIPIFFQKIGVDPAASIRQKVIKDFLSIVKTLFSYAAMKQNSLPIFSRPSAPADTFPDDFS